MEGTMKVCVLTGQRQLEWTEREIPQPVEENLRKILMMLEELAQQSLQVKLLIYFI